MPESKGVTFEGGRVLKSVKLPGSADRIIVLDRPGSDVHRNVLRVTPEDVVVWRIDYAPSFGNYIDVAIRGGALQAWSWSGYMVRLDPDSGAVLETEFVK